MTVAFKRRFIKAPASIIKKDSVTIIPALSYMMRITGYCNTCDSWHEYIDAYRCLSSRYKWGSVTNFLLFLPHNPSKIRQWQLLSLGLSNSFVLFYPSDSICALIIAGNLSFQFLQRGKNLNNRLSESFEVSFDDLPDLGNAHSLILVDQNIAKAG